jgi:PAS domain S-box-containing protein
MNDRPAAAVSPPRGLTLRAALGVFGAAAGCYVLAIALFIGIRVAHRAVTVRRHGQVLLAQYDELERRAGAIQLALDQVRQLSRGGVPPRSATAGAASVHARIDSVVAVGDVRLGVPTTIRLGMAGMARQYGRLGVYLQEAMASLELGRRRDAAARLRAADSVVVLINLHVGQAMRSGWLDLTAREDSLAQAATTTAWAVGAWLAVGLVLIPLMLLFLRRRFYDPLAEIERGLARVAAGNFGTPIPVSREDELGRLSAHFNETARILSQRAQESLQRATQRISEAALATSTLQELFAAIHQIVGELMPAKNFYIALCDPGCETIRFPYFVDERDEPPQSKKPGRGLTEYVLRTGQPLLGTPEVFENLVLRGEVEPLGAPSLDWLGVPLVAQDQTIGVLAVQSYTEGVRYGEVELNILRFVSTQIALAIERKAGEDAVRESRATFQVFIDAIPEPALLLDVDARVVATNRAMAQRMGSAPSDLVGRYVYDLLPAEVAAARKREVDAVIRTRQGATFEDTARGRSYINYVYPVLDPGGEVTRVAVFALDITDRKLAEEAQRELQEQLRQSQKMEEVGRLAGGVAHDFNNLLTAILSYVDLLLPSIEDPSAREDADEIRKAALRAADLTRQLLAFSRRQVLQPKLLDLNAIVLETEKLLGRLIGEHVVLRTKLASDLGVVRADPGQLEQVIVNLAVNARDAMARGGTLTIETVNADAAEVRDHEQGEVAPGRYVALRVSDTGSGMDAETRKRLFEPFFTTKQLGKGTGLGLATVYGIVKQSGGFIWVDSEPGKGATFTIHLPQAEADAVPAGQTAPRREALRGDETILLVEDDDAVRDLGRRILAGHGYRVMVAPDGAAALRLAAAHDGPVHLLLTDIVMPGMNGRELAEQLGATRPGMALLCMSGYTDDTIVQHGVLTSDIQLLQKPFTPEALLARVREVLDAGGTPRSARTYFIEHEGHRILFTNAAGIKDADVALTAIAEQMAVFDTQPKGSLLTLTYIKDSVFTPAVIEALQNSTRHNAPYVKAAAVVGLSGLQRVAFTAVKLFTGRAFQVFDELEEAKRWLAAQGAAANSGSTVAQR